MSEFFRKAWRISKIIFLLLLFSGIAVGIYYMTGTYSDGLRAGTIIKFSKRGMLFKTYEGELNMGMVITDNAAANFGSNIYTFSVPPGNKEVITKIEEAMLTGNRVKLFYKEKYVTYPWVGDTKYHIYKVEVLESVKVPHKDTIK